MALIRIVVLATLALGGFVPTSSAQMFDEQTVTRFPDQATGAYTNQCTIGDIDDDGDLDILWANGGRFSSPGTDERQDIYINDGTGVFTNEWNTRLGWSGLARGVEMGDIDGDGDLDLIYAQDFNRQPTLWENDGNGFFTDITTQLPQIALSSSRAQFGDIDNDGDLDIYITSGTTSRFTCGQYRIYVNDGTGNFTDETASRHPTGVVCNNMDCIFGDFDNDFDLDIRTASTGSNNSRLYENDGTGVFSQVPGVPADSTCYSYDWGDIDGDGDLDLVGINGNAGSTEILIRNNTAGTTWTNISSQVSPNSNLDDNDSKFFDYDMDGDLDLLIGRLGTGGERIYNNNGAGLFTQVAGLIEIITDSTLDIMVADMDNDGDFDFITAQGESGSFVNRIYINTTGPADGRDPQVLATEQQADTDDIAGPYVIRARVADDMTSDRNFFDKGVTLNYIVDSGPIQTAEMRHSGGRVYRGEIPGQPGGSMVEYFVTAIDFNDNEGIGSTLSFLLGSIPGDIDGDGIVGITDLLSLLAEWGPCSEPCLPACPGDIDEDCVVGIVDLLTLLANWS